LNIAITGGGTGGHLTIAKAIKEELNKRGIKPIFIGSTYGQDRAWFERDAGFEEKYFFETSGVVNQKKVAKLFSLFKIIKASWSCRAIFKKHNIDAVFSVGGYSAAPASFSSIAFGKKLYIHEQNAVLGKLHKILKPKADAIFSSYLDESPVKSYPVREIFFQNARIRKEIKTIIFLGGSQGATAINKFAMSIAPTLKEKGIKIIHQSGKRDLDMLKEYYQENEIDVDLFDFSNIKQTSREDKRGRLCYMSSRSQYTLGVSSL